VTLSDFSATEQARTALSKQVSAREFQEWRNQSSSFEAMAYYGARETAVIRSTGAEYARVAGVSPEFFRVFALQPVAGRFPTAEEMKPGGSGAVLLSYDYWQGHFDGDPRAIGQTVRVYGLRTIVGVLPPGFRFPEKTDLWFAVSETTDSRAARNYLAVARLKPGVSLEQAQTEMTLIAKRVERQYPDTNKGWSVAVARMRDDLVRDVRLTLYLLVGAVAIVLLIACANTATLLLGKASARAHEVAVRTALGASRRRIIRQLVTESLLLSLTAGGAGLLFAYFGSKALVALAPVDLPRLGEAGIDRWVLAFTFGISIITSLLFGLAPALYASKVELSDTLKQGGRRIAAGGGAVRARGALVIAEIALAVTLVSASGLLIKSLAALQTVALGFRPENVLVMRATVPGSLAAATPRARQFFQDMLSQIARLPGVLAAGATMAPPGLIDSSGGYFIDRLPVNPDWTRAPNVVLSIVAPATFAALGIPLKSGRDFSGSDTSERPLVAVVNEALVRRSFPHQNPLGRKIFCSFDTLEGMTIIGVVGDVRQLGPEREPIPECYMTYEQHGFNGLTLSIVTRTTGDPAMFSETLRRLARERSADVPMKFTTMEAMLSGHLAAPRFRTLLVAVFASLALCLAMAGVYGAVAYAVSRRSNEIAVRIALGADPGGVVRLVLRQVLTLASIGLGLGLAGSIADARLFQSMLFQVRPNDLSVYMAVAAMVGAVTLIAGYIPASRVAKIDPMVALRQE
jgi:putative ABC transport system permease protein